MTDLADFLLARIAEDEAVAHAAEPGPWVVGTTAEWTGPVRGTHVASKSARPRMVADMATGYPRSLNEPTAEHIVRHDPARVLAECDAKRRIAEAHPLTSDVVPVHTGPQPDVGCETCHTVTAMSVTDPDYVEALGPCETLLALALPYADHPDYRQEWRP